MSNFQLHSVFPTGIGDAIMHDVEYLGILKKDIISQYRKDEEKYGFETNEGPTWGRYQPGWGKLYSQIKSPDSDPNAPDQYLDDSRAFWQSDPYIHQREPYLKLMDFVDENVKHYLDAHGYVYEKFYTTIAWSNVYRHASSIHEHKHPNSFVSWVFFVDAKNAPILFRHEIPDNSIRPHVKFNIPENSFQIAWKPVNGMLVMWPSWMTHGSSPNQSNEERISISGNVMLGGKIGQSEHLTESQLDNWSNKQTQDIDDSSQFANLNIEPQPGGPGNY